MLQGNVVIPFAVSGEGKEALKRLIARQVQGTKVEEVLSLPRTKERVLCSSLFEAVLE